MKYGVMFYYSWNDFEGPYGKFDTTDDAYKKACEIAGAEAYEYSSSKECDCTARYIATEKAVDLHYEDDDTHCYYRISDEHGTCYTNIRYEGEPHGDGHIALKGNVYAACIGSGREEVIAFIRWAGKNVIYIDPAAEFAEEVQEEIEKICSAIVKQESEKEAAK